MTQPGPRDGPQARRGNRPAGDLAGSVGTVSDAVESRFHFGEFGLLEADLRQQSVLLGLFGRTIDVIFAAPFKRDANGRFVFVVVAQQIIADSKQGAIVPRPFGGDVLFGGWHKRCG